jgi:hypothetical protein
MLHGILQRHALTRGHRQIPQTLAPLLRIFASSPASAQRPLTIRLIGSPRTQVPDEIRALQRSTKALTAATSSSTLPASSSTPAFAVDLDVGHGEVGHLAQGSGATRGLSLSRSTWKLTTSLRRRSPKAKATADRRPGDKKGLANNSSHAALPKPDSPAVRSMACGVRRCATARPAGALWRQVGRI